MSNEAILDIHNQQEHLHDAHADHSGHTEHKQHFINKYIFSMDHKIISKQFLITAMFWAVVGGLMSVFFRIQLGFPEDTFVILQKFLGDWAHGGKMDPEIYYGLVTIHGTVLVFFVLTGGLSGTFSNMLIPLQIGARDMASPFLNMLSYWIFA
ncbi:MAG TPA: cbb3-type cytochrome c oxidase subunit I, partial [Chitinophagaceae bacterium]|nr:cbb3-type cytochrome c oxidase subunit I [Chitinophagaceae bacterium]